MGIELLHPPTAKAAAAAIIAPTRAVGNTANVISPAAAAGVPGIAQLGAHHGKDRHPTLGVPEDRAVGILDASEIPGRKPLGNRACRGSAKRASQGRAVLGMAQCAAQACPFGGTSTDPVRPSAHFPRPPARPPPVLPRRFSRSSPLASMSARFLPIRAIRCWTHAAERSASARRAADVVDHPLHAGAGHVDSRVAGGIVDQHLPVREGHRPRCRTPRLTRRRSARGPPGRSSIRPAGRLRGWGGPVRTGRRTARTATRRPCRARRGKCAASPRLRSDRGRG